MPGAPHNASPFMTQKRSVFLTGSTGFIGKELLKSLLTSHPQDDFFLLIRGRTQHGADTRFANLIQELAQETGIAQASLHPRLKLVEGDIALPDFGLSLENHNQLAKSIDTIFHSAAHVILEAPYEESKRLNFRGTMACLALARKSVEMGHFLRFNHISTAFVAGQRKGIILENELDCQQGFNNNYERVKFEAEVELHKAMAEVPITIFRPSMVMGHSVTGWTNSFNVLYGPIKFSYLGLLPRVPGNHHARIDTVSIDFIVDALRHLSSLPDSDVVGKTFHLTVGSKNSITVPELIVETFKHFRHYVKEFNLENPLREPTMIPPALFRFGVYCKSIFSDPREKKYLENLLIYADYTSYQKDFNSQQALALLEKAGIRPLPLKNYLGNLVRYCIQTHFGKSDHPRHVRPRRKR